VNLAFATAYVLVKLHLQKQYNWRALTKMSYHIRANIQYHEAMGKTIFDSAEIETLR
jgi:hypothetical protein